MRKKWFFCDAVNTLFPKADSFQTVCKKNTSIGPEVLLNAG